MHDSRRSLATYGVPLALALVNLSRYLSPDFIIDDSFISLRIAENWVRHGALTYDLTRPPVEGMTNLLWTLLAAPVIAGLPGLDPAAVLRLAGAAMHLGTVALVVSAARALTRSQAAAAAAGVLVAVPGTLGFHALSALETPLFVLGVAAAARLIVAERLTRTGAAGLGAVLGALALTRPEGLALGAFFAAAAWRRHGRGAALAAGVPFAICAAGVTAFRLAYYGALVPNTAGAKSAGLTFDWGYVAAFGRYGLGGLGVAAALVGAYVEPRVRSLAVAALLFTAGVAATGGDWMPGYRRLIPVFVLALIAAAPALVHARRGIRWFTAAAFAAVLAGNLALTAHKRDASLYVNETWLDLGRLAAATPELNRVALIDIGAFGYTFGRSIYDLAGLTDRRIAAQPGGHLTKGWDEAYFRAQNPDAIFIVGVLEGRAGITLRQPERDVLASIAAHGGYSVHALLPLRYGAVAALLVRTGVLLPPEQWGSPLGLGASELPSAMRAVVTAQ